MKQIQKTFIMSAKRIFHILMHLALIAQLNSCFLKQDRTTTVYGTITDQHGQPVDSIMILAQGMRYLNFESLNHTYSDLDGHFEMVIEVPKRFRSIDISVPFYPTKNPKYLDNYKGKQTTKNDVKTNNCCITTIGQKTKYDFQLIPK